MIFNRHLNILIIIAMTLLSISCRQKEPKYKIGVAQCSSDVWREKMNEEMRREMLFNDDAYLEIRSAGDNNEQQIKDIEYFINNKFDIIITAPNEAEAITPVIKKAYLRGIPVIIFDRNIIGDSYTAYMELDNVGIGKTAARYAASLLKDKEGKILEIKGLDGSTPAAERHQGFFDEVARHDNLSIVESRSAAWNGEKAYNLADSLLSIHPEINLIYAHNDVMAIGASRAVKEKGLDNVKILGTDASPELGIKAVIDGEIDATFIYPTEGNRVIRTAMAILKHEKFDRKDHIPALSTVDKTNAEILIRQNQLLKDETEKIRMLKEKNDDIGSRHRVTVYFLYAVGLGGILLIVVIILLLKTARQRSKYQKILTDKNKQLEVERDKQNTLYAQLNEATHSKLVFFTNVSHDLRTPLTLIAQPVETVAKAEYLLPQHKSLMNIALKNIRILRRLIDQILDFRRYENGKTELSMCEITPIPLIDEWMSSFHQIARERNIRLISHLDISDNRTLALDVEKVERVFFNLLSNAMKHTDAGGSITVKAGFYDDCFTFSVIDTGVGISKEVSEKIFDRFYQADKIRPKGSGIGLSLAKAFIQLHGGEIKVDSTPGKGSEFSVLIPVTHVDSTVCHTADITTINDIKAELEEIAPSDTPVETDKPILLIIDDNPDIRNLVGELLSDEYNIISAENGRSGVMLTRKFVPDLVICDIMMPVMDGLEACRLIKDDISTSHIPVLMLTACKLDEQRLQSYDSGADGFLSKPFNTEILRSRCRNLLLNRMRIKNLYTQQTLSPGIKMKDSGRLPVNSEEAKNQVESEFYNTFLKLLEKNYSDQDLSLDFIASNLGIGQTQLARKIKALTGMSPVDIIKNYRLKLSRHLLLTTEKTISEIAYDVGFSSPAYFTKCFRKFYNESPSELRSNKSM